MPPEVAAPVEDVAPWLWETPSLPVFTYPPAPPVPAPPVAAPPLAVAGPDVAVPAWMTDAFWIDAWTFAFRVFLSNPLKSAANTVDGISSPTASTPSASSLRDTYLTSFRHSRTFGFPASPVPAGRVGA